MGRTNTVPGGAHLPCQVPVTALPNLALLEPKGRLRRPQTQLPFQMGSCVRLVSQRLSTVCSEWEG